MCEDYKLGENLNASERLDKLLVVDKLTVLMIRVEICLDITLS